LTNNILRDKENKEKLKELGWRVLEVWECELQEMDNLVKKIASFFGVTNEVEKK
jgi:DNA mismatch endonuclease, patch repair protein